jgi:signal transduction histidine kinase
MANHAPQPVILVIDDERGPRESLRILLKHRYCVLCADNVDAGLDLLRQSQPDAVIMDIRMPGKTGLEGLAELRRVDPCVSVIMLTGFGTLETAQEAIRLGANDYVCKPFDTVEMEQVIIRNVQRTRLERTHRNAERELAKLNRQLLEELDRKQSMAELGQKSAELVHDLRNPLTVVMGSVEMLSDQLAQSRERLGTQWPETEAYLEMIQKSVNRCKELADLWLSLGKRDPQRMKPMHVRRLVEDVLQSVSPVASTQGVRIEMDMDDTDGEIAVDSIQMLRALHNVLTNAIEAVTSKQGVIRVSCRRQENRVEIRVEDNGCGISEEDASRVFEPYYTTKKLTGTGLGLFITKKVVEDHHGSIELKSTPEVGTAICIQLPLLDRPEVASA